MKEFSALVIGYLLKEGSKLVPSSSSFPLPMTLGYPLTIIQCLNGFPFNFIFFIFGCIKIEVFSVDSLTPLHATLMDNTIWTTGVIAWTSHQIKDFPYTIDFFFFWRIYTIDFLIAHKCLNSYKNKPTTIFFFYPLVLCPKTFYALCMRTYYFFLDTLLLKYLTSYYLFYTTFY